MKSQALIGHKRDKVFLNSYVEFFERIAPQGMVPPQAVEFEQTLLGVLLTSQDMHAVVAEMLGPVTEENSPFYYERHTLIYLAIQTLIQRGEPADLLTATSELRRMGKLDDIGGPSYLVELTQAYVSTASVPAYVAEILDKKIGRELIRVCESAKVEAFGGFREFRELLSETESALMGLTEHTQRGAQPLSKATKAAFDAIRDAEAHEGIIGVPFYIKDIDDLTLGIETRELTVLAAGTSEGKSAFALQTAINNAKHDTPVAIFSLEMSRTAILHRIWANLARVEHRVVRSGCMTDDEWTRLRKAIDDASKLPIYVNEQPGLTPLEIRASLQRLARDKGVKLCIVDFLQIVRPTKPQTTREREIATVIEEIRAANKEIGTSALLLSQFNRDADLKKYAPELRHLKESSAIEQYAGTVIFLWDKPDKPEAQKGRIEVLVRKARNGKKGETAALFEREYQAFESLPPEFPTFPIDQRYEKESALF